MPQATQRRAKGRATGEKHPANQADRPVTPKGTRPLRCLDGNDAAAHVAYRASEVIAIYPITPSSTMGELADEWASREIPNVFGGIPRVIQMQSEGGAAGAVHGALQAGALTTTFTASQGLLLMIPNMYKIAGELTCTVFHIAARSVATHALSIFGDHSDVMAARQTGFAMLFSANVQEVMDLALVAHAATLESRVPFLHAFDGFRTSHEIQKVDVLSDDDIRALLSPVAIHAHRGRALSPDHPVIRGTAHNPDTFFQAREAANPFYAAVPEAVQRAMDALAARTGRPYHLFDYVGAPDADRVVIAMGSGVETIGETVEHLAATGEKVGAIKVRLFRPFSAAHLMGALPATVKTIAVLDRTKEPGGAGEPLYQDVITAVCEDTQSQSPHFKHQPRVVGGRYGLSSKEFTPAMVKAVLDNLAQKQPRNHFTVGISDDVSHTSLEWDPSFWIEPQGVVRAVFWGLGSDGTVGANKNSIKIIGEETDRFVQGYFVYDSKKAGARTVSHLRFGPNPIRSPYLIEKADFVAVHQYGFLDRYDVLDLARDGAVLLLNAPYPTEQVWEHIPEQVRREIIEKKLKVYAIDAYALARENNMGVRINTIMQTAFFALSGVLERDDAIARIKDAITKTYGKRGEAVVRANHAMVDASIAHLHELKVPAGAPAPAGGTRRSAEGFVQRLLAGDGDSLPVSAFPADGTYPTGTTAIEKRNIALEVPVWEPDLCIQCGKCVMVCPHSVIRGKVAPEAAYAGAPQGFQHEAARWRELSGQHYTLQVSADDCTGCRLCVEICPARDKSNVARKAINMHPRESIGADHTAHWDFFLALPEVFSAGSAEAQSLGYSKVKDVQLKTPLFEFSSACAGCGETPYLRLMTQLFGDRVLVANATGCSSIYGGNLPTTPWTANGDGRGPAWSNSLFEDNAEFGLGMREALDAQQALAQSLLRAHRGDVAPELAGAILEAEQVNEDAIAAQRHRVAELKAQLRPLGTAWSKDLLAVADALVRKSVWIVGGDGWAYDIGFGGLDHVLAGGRNVNLLVLDTEVYSNTGGQSSKATPMGAVAKFASGGKATPKKDIGAIAMSYGHVYVAQIAMGASDQQTLRALVEAESYPGPSLIIAYSHCIAHGIDMANGLTQQKLASESGYWPLYRFDPRLAAQGRNPLQLDSAPPKIKLKDYIYNESRYRMLLRSNPEHAALLLKGAQANVDERWKRLQRAAFNKPGTDETPEAAK
ncbi:MAG: pyruvate:ferredoxin (flavodoxin) oxidoreductase [Candidatus Krumholzibacteria bacterium]|nr:pyruvate:ferredoxin (flavodoxin) oxidoreductase [Candidatus Krumholzibacteria bacterium]MDH4336891.1 pyruvate:ferredoxin (flavodoxin) oxidoreductase [Candidatus Krumholzibacteria bacterium]MDH5269222.1 pyruvate:ferredoxin (flavodoxin) oxidoreductase [Candidatus Krumholzibacteria bacterium]